MKGKFFSTQITLNSDETAEEGDRISDVCCTIYGCLLTAKCVEKDKSQIESVLHGNIQDMEEITASLH